MMSEAPVDWDTLTFSMTETDFMYMTKTAIDEPWEPGEMRPYGNISISPAAGVMNYGQGLFEGMKATEPLLVELFCLGRKRTLAECREALIDSRCLQFLNQFSSTQLNSVFNKI